MGRRSISIKKLLALLICMAALAYPLKGAYRVVKWQAYIWAPSYLSGMLKNSKEIVPDRDKHVVFVMVDHYEPGKGEVGARKNEEWLKKFKEISKPHVDSFGNRFRYTWFYPYEEQNERVLAALSGMAFEGYGEVELHWHHPRVTNESFPGMLRGAIKWYQKYGALTSVGSDARSHFGFIHGNWALDNSQPRCGVGKELQILLEHGCYADFTFSTIGTSSQPEKINSIYYAVDTPDSKSYNTGIDVEVGKPVNDRLMIFEGPIAFEFAGMGLEYGAVESYALPTKSRINRWIDLNIHVKGRPEWVFVKVYSHGIQNADAILDHHLDRMLEMLEKTCRERGLSLHYMTAREAYNVVKAAEDGRTGNPESYRDYRIVKPRNAVTRFNH